MPRRRDFAALNKALKGEAIVLFAEALIIRLRRTDESLRLAHRVKINEHNQLSSFLLIGLFCFTSKILSICCY